jgi:Domain of unknown function (DUF932)
MNVKMKELVAGATIAAVLGVTATGTDAGVANAAPAHPPAMAGQAGHSGPAPQGDPGRPAAPPPPQDHPGGPGGPPADNRGPNDHGGPLRGRAEETFGGNGMVLHGATDPRQVGLGCPASASMESTIPAGVGAAATAIRLLGIHGDAGMGSRFQSVGLRVLLTPIRIVCANTQSAALASARSTFGISHTSGARATIQQVREALKLFWRYIEAFEVPVLQGIMGLL